MRGYKLVNSVNSTKKRYNEMLGRLSAEAEKGSTGVFGKFAEPTIRYYLNSWDKKTIMRKNDFRARTMKSIDCSIKVNGKYCNFEIKTGCGDLSYNTDGIYEDELLSNADYVVWIPLTRGVNENNFDKFAYVFTRAAFIELLYKMGSVKKVKGEYIIPEICDKLNVRYVEARRWTQIATFDNCTGKLEVLYNELDNTPTLEQFVKTL